ncbi:uncharacterized protein TNCV_1262361 [Trichonephila clavipes]|nr:uncharacterized protein TNCV_1262361 [Trichonephila clavipes]
MSRKKVFKTCEKAVEYLFSEELESKMIALSPEVDKLTDEEGFDDTETLSLSVRDVAGRIEIAVPYENHDDSREKDLSNKTDNNEAKSQTIDRAFKIRKLIAEMNANFQKLGIFGKHLSIDEMMIRYYGHRCCKQYIKVDLKESGFRVTETIRSDKIQHCALEIDSTFKKTSRGSHAFYFDVKNKITAVKWHDNKCITLVTNIDIIEILTSVSRREKRKAEKNKIEHPCLVNNYNKNMGAVDSHDWLLEKYTIKIR